MKYGTRTLRFNVKALVGMMRWPFPDGTTVRIEDNRLPPDTTFVRVAKVEEPHVYIVLASQMWEGDTEALIDNNPTFRYTTKGGHVALPNLEKILRRGATH